MPKIYPDELKESILKQLCNSKDSIAQIARSAGIPYTTVATWKQSYQKGINMNDKFSPQEKLNILFQTSSMSETELGEFCRKKGIFPDMLEQWKQTCLDTFGHSPEKKFIKKERKLKNKIKQLQKEIRKKDKTIAETTALLVLKKKWDAFLQEQEDEK